MSQKEYDKMSVAEKKKEDWMNSKWRPMMGWSYMLTCICDFVLFPVLWSIIQTRHGGQVTSQWNPITLQGAGLYHVAMGAVLGLTAFGRTQEKIAGANNGNVPGSTSSPAAFGSAPAGGFSTPSANSAAAAPSFGASRLSAGSFGSAPTAAPVVAGFGGKAAPPPQIDPEI